MKKEQASSMLTCSFCGSTATIKEKLEKLLEATKADEMMVVSAIWDHQARLRSFELLAQAMDQSELKFPNKVMSA
jgi:alkanesulfonate monooxygenase SsuD/methylene tetrahydromethanopterin reductase-like flavin-dependent oxidoreductase (luciferase family)